MIAAWLGPQFALLSLFLGVVGAAMVGLAWMILRGRRSALTMRLPFGAFLCAAAIFAVFAGRPILESYTSFSDASDPGGRVRRHDRPPAFAEADSGQTFAFAPAAEDDFVAIFEKFSFLAIGQE
jgi:hypothetical protein